MRKGKQDFIINILIQIGIMLRKEKKNNQIPNVSKNCCFLCTNCTLS